MTTSYLDAYEVLCFEFGIIMFITLHAYSSLCASVLTHIPVYVTSAFIQDDRGMGKPVFSSS